MTAVHHRATRWLWTGAGFVSVAIGSVGIVVPGLPTTGFFILAASCFARSSPRFEQWVLDLPGVGQLVRDHRDGLGMPRRAKAMAITMMLTAVALSATFAVDGVAGVLLVVLGLIGTWYVGWRVPTREVVVAQRGLSRH